MTQSTTVCKVILCVDDEEIILSLLESALPMLGHLVVCAHNGAEALKLAATLPFDAVILDYSLPDMYGEKVATELKRLRPDTPVILFSASQDIPSSALEQVSVFVPKSDGLRTLLPVLQRVLSTPTRDPIAIRRVPRFPVQIPFTVTVNRAGTTAMLRGLSVNFGEGGIGGKSKETLNRESMCFSRSWIPDYKSSWSLVLRFPIVKITRTGSSSLM